MSMRKHLVSNMVLLLVVLMAFFVTLFIASKAEAVEPSLYDPYIEAASDTWLPGSDWRRYKAQLYQESRLDTYAVSPAGASGIAQFMPGTWGDVAPVLGYDLLSPFVAEPAINAGAFYLAKQMGIWTEPRSYDELRILGEAGYNAGTGNILSAQRECRALPCLECRNWDEISLYLHRVTGRHSAETIDYIQKIDLWLDLIRTRQ